MNGFARRLPALLTGLVATAAMAAPLAGSAQAADPQVQIIQQVDSPDGPLTRETALSASINSNGFVSTKLRHVGGVAPSQRWIKHPAGQNYFTYENVYWHQCLTSMDRKHGSNLMVRPCTPGNRSQMWTQGFSTAEFRKLQNLNSGDVATLKKSATVNNTTGDVIQDFDQGLNRQLWREVTPA
jgi:hypothetical protein